MAIDKKSLALGLAIGGKWNYHAESGDLCVLGPVICSMEIKRPTAFSDDVLPLTEGAGYDVLSLISAGTVWYGVVPFADVSGALAEDMDGAALDISGAYLYTGEVQEVNMDDNETSENLNGEEISVTMEVTFDE